MSHTITTFKAPQFQLDNGYFAVQFASTYVVYHESDHRQAVFEDYNLGPCRKWAREHEYRQEPAQHVQITVEPAERIESPLYVDVSVSVGDNPTKETIGDRLIAIGQLIKTGRLDIHRHHKNCDLQGLLDAFDFHPRD